MKKKDLKILAVRAGCLERSVYRALDDIGIADLGNYSDDIVNLTITYLKVTGKERNDLRDTLKRTILSLAYPTIPAVGLGSDFKEYLIEQSRQKDKQLKKKEKQVDRYSEAVVTLSNKLLGLVDDISMLRIQDTGTLQRLYDKNVLADLLSDLKPGTAEHTAVNLLLQKANEKN